MAQTNEMARRNAGNGNQVANTAPAGSIATTLKEAKITNQVLEQITQLSRGGQLRLPDNYSAENALAAAYLMFQEIQDKDRRLIMQNGQPTGVVTTRSMVNALMHMVSQGLNPAKKQCYFIVYGDQLTHQRSYFGDMALAIRAMPGLTAEDFYFDSINEGDEFEAEKIRNSRGQFVTTVGKHKIPFPRGEKVAGAYCGAVLKGCDLGCTVFDMARITKSWCKSKTAGYDNSTHKLYPGEMAIRTVIRHYCKGIINTSDDRMLKDLVERADMDAVEAEVAQDALQHANQQMIDVSPPARLPAPQALAEGAQRENVDTETGEVSPGLANGSGVGEGDPDFGG